MTPPPSKYDHLKLLPNGRHKKYNVLNYSYIDLNNYTYERLLL